MTIKKIEKSRTKKPYQKPQLKRIRLVYDEAVLQACKTVDGIFNTWLANACTIVFECRNVGS